MWIGVASQDKMEIRSCLPKLLLAQHKTVPYFIRNKLCKVIVDIGRQDWPMFYHDFFTNTLQVGPTHVKFSKKGSSQTVLLSCRLGCNIAGRWFCLCLVRLNDRRILSRKVIKWTDSAQEIVSPQASYSRSRWLLLIPSQAKRQHVERCICVSLPVDPVSGSGSAGPGDAENHVGGAGVSPRRPERR